MTTRAQLQSKSIDELRTIASTAGIEIDGLQKSKLITALMDAGHVPEEAPTTDVDLPKAMPRTEKSAEAKSGQIETSPTVPERARADTPPYLL